MQGPPRGGPAWTGGVEREAPQAQPRQEVSRLLGWGPGQGSFPPEPTPPRHPPSAAPHGRQSWEVPFCSLTRPSTGAGSHRRGAPWGSSGVQGGGRRAPVPQHLGRECGLPASTQGPAGRGVSWSVPTPNTRGPRAHRAQAAGLAWLDHAQPRLHVRLRPRWRRGGIDRIRGVTPRRGGRLTTGGGGMGRHPGLGRAYLRANAGPHAAARTRTRSEARAQGEPAPPAQASPSAASLGWGEQEAAKSLG